MQIDEALVYDVALLIRSAMPSSVTDISYNNCSAVTTPREEDRLQSKRLVDTLRNVSITTLPIQFCCLLFSSVSFCS